jgi:hypothetical protein
VSSKRKRRATPKRRPAPKPPPAAIAFARAYRCQDCTGRARLRPRPDSNGVWHLDVRHDDGCPVLAGTVSPAPAGLRAAAAAGPRVLYIGPEGTPT